MGMKRKTKLIIIISAGVLMAFLIFCLAFIQGILNFGRVTEIKSNIKSFALSAQLYEGEYGHFPVTIDQIVRSETDPGRQQHLTEMLHDKYHDTYEYKLVTNGMEFKVTGPRSLFITWTTVEMKFDLKGKDVSPP
jgi:hypothetical protein